MKNTLTIALSVLLLAFAMPAFAQKYACVNTDYVLKSMPDYANAQQRLDRYVTDWKKELDDKNSELMAMRVLFLGKDFSFSYDRRDAKINLDALK